MRRLSISATLIAAASTIAVAHIAMAADMPTKAPPPVPAPARPLWTGFYVGGHIGGAWSRNGQSEGQGFDGIATGSPLLPFDTDDSAVIGGVQIGYNWQFAPQWVIGIEADFSWTNLNGSQTYSPIPPGQVSATSPSFISMSRDVKWLASARGRLGYAWDRALLYFTGGAAWSKTDFEGINSRAGGAFVDLTSFDSTKTGWVVGGGLEYMLWKNWSARVQYLYYSFNGESAIAPGPATAFSTFSWGRTQINSATIGINYHF